LTEAPLIAIIIIPLYPQHVLTGLPALPTAGLNRSSMDFP
jgi:hypothetical protein